MNNEKDKNLTRFLLTFFLGWIGSIIINATDLKPKGYKSRTLAYFFLTYVTFGIYGLVAAISNLSFDPAKETNIGYAKEYGYVYSTNEETDSINTILDEQNKQPQTLEINMLIKKAIVLLMAIFSLVMLSFSLCEDKLFYSLPENGFTFMTFMSYLITSSFNWAIYLIGGQRSFLLYFPFQADWALGAEYGACFGACRALPRMSLFLLLVLLYGR